MANNEIRSAAKESGVHHWQIASELGVSEGTFCRRLRSELDLKEKSMILKIIKKLKEG